MLHDRLPVCLASALRNVENHVWLLQGFSLDNRYHLLAARFILLILLEFLFELIKCLYLVQSRLNALVTLLRQVMLGGQH